MFPMHSGPARTGGGTGFRPTPIIPNPVKAVQPVAKPASAQGVAQMAQDAHEHNQHAATGNMAGLAGKAACASPAANRSYWEWATSKAADSLQPYMPSPQQPVKLSPQQPVMPKPDVKALITNKFAAFAKTAAMPGAPDPMADPGSPVAGAMAQDPSQAPGGDSQPAPVPPPVNPATGQPIPGLAPVPDQLQQQQIDPTIAQQMTGLMADANQVQPDGGQYNQIVTAAAKHAWQDNSKPSQSASTESTSIGLQHNPDVYAKGQSAWDSTNKYFHKGTATSAAEAFKIRHAFDAICKRLLTVAAV